MILEHSPKNITEKKTLLNVIIVRKNIVKDWIVSYIYNLSINFIVSTYFPRKIKIIRYGVIGKYLWFTFYHVFKRPFHWNVIQSRFNYPCPSSVLSSYLREYLTDIDESSIKERNDFVELLCILQFRHKLADI